MADIQHKNIADADRHEPKGASTAAAGQVYVSDGAGSGSWQTPAQGSKVLLSTQNAANSPSIAFTSLITSTYSTYEVEYYAVRAASASNSGFFLEHSVNNGASYLTSSYPFNSVNYLVDRTDPQVMAGAGSSTGGWLLVASGSMGNTAIDACNGSIKLLNFPNGTSYKHIESTSFAGGTSYRRLSGFRAAVTPINAIRFSFGTGNITSGTFKLYGIV